MNATSAKKLADQFNRRTVSVQILDQIKNCASRGLYSYYTDQLDPLTAAAVKYAFINLGYKVIPFDKYLYISWYL